MRRWRDLVLAGMMLSVGYLLGTMGAGRQVLQAQEQKEKIDLGIAMETADKIRSANRSLKEAADALQAEGKYESITNGVNAFLVLSGGGNAREDLASGRGVDPETFAALYAGQAIPEIQDLLGRDEQGRLTYNNEVVRIYSVSRLQRLYAQRLQITDVGY